MRTGSPRRISGLKKKVTGGWPPPPQNQGPNNLWPLLNIMCAIKSRLNGRPSSTPEIRKAYILIAKLHVESALESPKRFLQVVKLVNTIMDLRVPYSVLVSSWVAAQLATYQEELSQMNLLT
jgi:hypothetical protein